MSHIQNPTHIQNPLKDLRWSLFAKMVKNYNYFSKVLHLRSLTKFWIQLSVNKYSLTYRVTSRYVLHDKYSDPCLLSKNQIYSGIFTSSSHIFRYTVAYLESWVTCAYSELCHLQNPSIFRTQDIFRTLSRHILAYPDRCLTLAYWEPYHIQDLAIFRILAYLRLEAYSESCSFRYIQVYSLMMLMTTLTFFF